MSYAPERREAGLIDVIDERRLVIDDVAVQQIAAPERVGGDGIDGFVVGEQRPAKGRHAQDDPQDEGRQDEGLEPPQARRGRSSWLFGFS